MDLSLILSITVVVCHVLSLFGGRALWPVILITMARGALGLLPGPFAGTLTANSAVWMLWISPVVVYTLLGRRNLVTNLSLSTVMSLVAGVGLSDALESLCVFYKQCPLLAGYLLGWEEGSEGVKVLFWFVVFWQFWSILLSTPYVHGFVAWFTQPHLNPVVLVKENRFERIKEMLRECFTIDFDREVNKVISARTGEIDVKVLRPEVTKSLDLKVDLSPENNARLTRAIFESVNAQNPLKVLAPESGADINRMAKTQVLFSNSLGVVAGMGTLIDTPNGIRLLTVGHVLRSCTAGDETVYVSSAVGGSGLNKAVNLGVLNYERITSFAVSGQLDHCVVLRVPDNLQSRLSLKAATETSTFKPMHGLVFSPPDHVGGKLRYSTGRLERKGECGLLVFAGSTVAGSSGAGVFISKKLVSVHVGTLDGGQGPCNLSYVNVPRAGLQANILARRNFLARHNVTLESGVPELTVWTKVEAVDSYDEDRQDDMFSFDDVDASGDEPRLTRYEALGDEYAAQSSIQLKKDEAKLNSMMHAMVMTHFTDWADDSDDDEDDQDHLQDVHEAYGRRDAGRIGKHGTTLRSVVFRPETSVSSESVTTGRTRDEEVAKLREQIAEAKAAVKRQNLERGRDNELKELTKQLLDLKSKLSEETLPDPEVILESCDDESTWSQAKIEVVKQIREAKELLKRKREEASKDRELEELRRQLAIVNSKLNSTVRFESASGNRSEDEDEPQDFGPGVRPPQLTTALKQALPSGKVSPQSESKSRETTQASKSGPTKPPPLSAKAAKKQKKKVKISPSKDGEGVKPLASPAESKDRSLMSMLAVLTQKLEAMELPTAPAKRPANP